jgi:hypothetical protein
MRKSTVTLDAQLATLRGAPQVLWLDFHLEVSGELPVLLQGTLKAFFDSIHLKLDGTWQGSF